MNITEVRVFPTESKDGKLKAFATMTFDDCFVVRNVKVIQGNNGLFVAMPSRKAMDACPKCRFKNVKGSKFCNQCGAQTGRQSAHDSSESTEKHGDHMDIAHPVTQECRVYIQEEILKAYNGEQGKSDTESKPVEREKPVPEESYKEEEKEHAEEIEVSVEPMQDVNSADIEEAKDIEL